MWNDMEIWKKGKSNSDKIWTDFVCLYNYEFWLSLCKIVRSSVILLLPLFSIPFHYSTYFSSVFFISFHYSICLSPILSISYHYSTCLSSIFPYHFTFQLTLWKIRKKSRLNSEKVWKIRVITKLPNSEQSYKGKVKTHNYLNRQNQSTTEKL
jgi:predicted membrane protein